MKKVILALLVLFSVTAKAQMTLVTKYGVLVDTSVAFTGLNSAINSKLSTATAASTYLTPTGSAASLTNFPTFNQSTTGSAASFTGSLVGDVSGTQGATSVNKLNGVALSGLATGIVKITTSTGVPSTAVAADFPTLNQSTTGNAATATNASTVTTNANLTGDVTSVGNASTLATVNSTVGSFTVASVTVNGKGLITAISSGAAALRWVVGEEQTGAATTTLTSASLPTVGTLRLSKNGVRLPAAKFSLSGSTITLTDTRIAADVFQLDYNY